MKAALKFLTLSLLIVLSAAMSGCQNDGHIGWIFGSWRLDGYTVDGQSAMDAQARATVFSFQNSVVMVTLAPSEHGDTDTLYGSWTEDGDSFTLDFSHSDDQRPSGTDLYSAPTWIGMQSMKMEMAIIHHDRRFTLSWTDPEGRNLVYKFKKIL